LETDKNSFEKAVYDPSNWKAGNYWQWPSVALDAVWERAAGSVHKGWPTKQGIFDDQSAVLLGVLDESKG